MSNGFKTIGRSLQQKLLLWAKSMSSPYQSLIPAIWLETSSMAIVRMTQAKGKIVACAEALRYVRHYPSPSLQTTPPSVSDDCDRCALIWKRSSHRQSLLVLKVEEELCLPNEHRIQCAFGRNIVSTFAMTARGEQALHALRWCISALLTCHLSGSELIPDHLLVSLKLPEEIQQAKNANEHNAADKVRALVHFLLQRLLLAPFFVA